MRRKNVQTDLFSRIYCEWIKLFHIFVLHVKKGKENKLAVFSKLNRIKKSDKI